MNDTLGQIAIRFGSTLTIRRNDNGHWVASISRISPLGPVVSVTSPEALHVPEAVRQAAALYDEAVTALQAEQR